MDETIAMHAAVQMALIDLARVMHRVQPDAMAEQIAEAQSRLDEVRAEAPDDASRIYGLEYRIALLSGGPLPESD